jgi:hypothetical protein
VGFDRAPSHFEFFADFGVITALQKEIGNLLLALA